MMFPHFTAAGALVRQAPMRIERPDGLTALQLGFVVCTVTSDLDDREGAARQIAAGLTLIQRIETIEQTARNAERLIDDMTRFAGQMSLPDYALLNEVPGQLRQLIGWAQTTRAAMAGQCAPAAPTAA